MLQQKRNAGYRAAEYVEDGMTVGLGTGSTAKHAVERIGERLKEEELDIWAIPTSKATEELAQKSGIPILSLDEVDYIDLTIDGADEVDDDLNLIKGGGGALLREKMVADYTDNEIIVVDPSKVVNKLGVSFDLPVEIETFWFKATVKKVEALGCSVEVRKKDEKELFRTDNGNYIVDCGFGGIDDPYELSNKLNSIPGVIENGLFLNLVEKVIVGKEEGYEEILKE